MPCMLLLPFCARFQEKNRESELELALDPLRPGCLRSLTVLFRLTPAASPNVGEAEEADEPEKVDDVGEGTDTSSSKTDLVWA